MILQLLCSPIRNGNFRKKTQQNITTERTPQSVCMLNVPRSILCSTQTRGGVVPISVSLSLSLPSSDSSLHLHPGKSPSSSSSSSSAPRRIRIVYTVSNLIFPRICKVRAHDLLRKESRESSRSSFRPRLRVQPDFHPS